MPSSTWVVLFVVIVLLLFFYASSAQKSIQKKNVITNDIVLRHISSLVSNGVQSGSNHPITIDFICSNVYHTYASDMVQWKEYQSFLTNTHQTHSKDVLKTYLTTMVTSYLFQQPSASRGNSLGTRFWNLSYDHVGLIHTEDYKTYFDKRWTHETGELFEPNSNQRPHTVNLCNLLAISSILHSYNEIYATEGHQRVFEEVLKEKKLETTFLLSSINPLFTSYKQGGESGFIGVVGTYTTQQKEQQKKECVIVFRPSNTNADWISSFEFGSQKDSFEMIYYWLTKKKYDTITKEFALANGRSVRAHEYYVYMVESFLPSIVSYLNAVDDGTKTTNVYIGGHSLGGALCLVAGMYIKSMGYTNVFGYSYNTPYIGNNVFYKQVNELFPEWYHFQVETDTVSSNTPSVFGVKRNLPNHIIAPIDMTVDPSSRHGCMSESNFTKCKQTENGLRYPMSFPIFYSKEYIDSLSTTDYLFVYGILHLFKDIVIRNTIGYITHAADFVLHPGQFEKWKRLIETEK